MPRATLSERERRFIHAFVGEANGNATKAAELAGYSPKSARQQGARLCTRAAVSEAISQQQAKLSNRAEITQERVLREYAAIAFSDIRQLFDEHGKLRPVSELPDDVARALASVEITKERTHRHGESTTEEWVNKIKTWDKPQALKALAEWLGMLRTERGDSRITVNIGFLTPANAGTPVVMPLRSQPRNSGA